MRGASGDRLGPEADRRRNWRPAPDGLESAPARGRVAATQAATRDREQVRVAVPGRSTAHGHERYARFTRPGHALTGDRTSTAAEKREQVGTEYAHAIIDDHTRVAYSELHPDERADTVVAFTRRALAWYAGHGITAKRVMTDNAWTYTNSHRFKELLATEGIAHLTIKPHRPQTNGKIERFHQTMAREWGYGLTYLSSSHRAEALPHWLNHYNEHRPHSALDNRPPISRVRNL